MNYRFIVNIEWIFSQYFKFITFLFILLKKIDFQKFLYNNYIKQIIEKNFINYKIKVV